MFNTMFHGAPVNGGSPFAKPVTRKVWNRSGETTKAGYRYKLDVHFATTSTTETDPLTGRVLSAVSNFNVGPADVEPASALNNIVISGGSSDLGNGPCVIAMEAAADNALVEVMEVGVVTAYVDGGTGVTYAPWTPVYSVASHNMQLPTTALYVALIQGTFTLTEGTPNTVNTLTLYQPKIYGVTLASYTHTTAGTAATTSVFFNGWGMHP